MLRAGCGEFNSKLMGQRRREKRPEPSTASEVAGQMASSPSQLLGLGLVLVVFVAVAYLPALNGKPIWDDNAHITAPELRSIHGLARIWTEPGATRQYYPLVHSVFWFEHQLWADSILPYHLVNILLHGISA